MARRLRQSLMPALTRQGVRSFTAYSHKDAAMRGLILIAVSLPSFAQSPVPPAAPQVTVGATQMKVLQFNWLHVPGATHYLLQYKPNATSPFAPYGNPILAPRAIASLTIPVHAFDWVNARYKVSACNAASCSDSADLPVQNLMLTSIGYFKASNTDAGDAFGNGVQLSQDGNTLVVSAAEASNATGVNGDQANNSSRWSGAVYVFRRTGAVWRQEAYLKPDVNQPNQTFGINFAGEGSERRISVSANGTVVAVGAPGENIAGVTAAGAAYLFARAADGSWSQTQKFQAPVPLAIDTFGMSVDLNDDGTLLKVDSRILFPSVGTRMGATRVYRQTAGIWALDARLFNEVGLICRSQMTGNGSAIVFVCQDDVSYRWVLRTQRLIGGYWTQKPDFFVSHYAAAVSGNASRVAFVSPASVAPEQLKILAWTGRYWTVEQILDPPPGIDPAMHGWGKSMAFNRNGTMLAIGSEYSTLEGAGVSDAAITPTIPPENADGAVYVYQRRGSVWTFLKVVKAPNAAPIDVFGRTLALSGNGLTLAVGALGEDSAARGIDGDQTNNSKESAGAVYLY
jgi:hypothetical protein